MISDTWGADFLTIALMIVIGQEDSWRVISERWQKFGSRLAT